MISRNPKRSHKSCMLVCRGSLQLRLAQTVPSQFVDKEFSEAVVGRQCGVIRSYELCCFSVVQCVVEICDCHIIKSAVHFPQDSECDALANLVHSMYNDCKNWVNPNLC